jgi:hypothetical protein
MDRDGVLQALEAGDFDGISHGYQPYEYGKTTYQVLMSVSGGTIELTKTASGKFFDGRENTRHKNSSTEYLTGSDAVDFIAQRPYYFALARPELFDVEAPREDLDVGLVAKHDGTCARCGDPIEPGQEIQTYSAGRYNRYEHVVCPSTAALEAEVVCSICGEKWVECDCP